MESSAYLLPQHNPTNTALLSLRDRHCLLALTAHQFAASSFGTHHEASG